MLRDHLVVYNLKSILVKFIAQFPGINTVHLFGSRVYQTGSTRSDCDLLVEYDQESAPKGSELSQFSSEQCSALDIFLLHHGEARSCANDSFIYASNSEELKRRLDAKPIWSRASGFVDEGPFNRAEDSWAFSVHGHVVFIPTMLPNGAIVENTLALALASARRQGLPSTPFIGDSIEKAASFLNDIARSMIIEAKQLGQRGSAKTGWTVNLSSEYDCQNLFFITVKPWLGSLGREEVEIIYDDKKEVSDFNAFNNKLIIEMKYIDDADAKREVVKDLKGLQDFYLKNTNVKVLLFVIYYKSAAGIDAARWEADYSSDYDGRRIVTSLVKLP